MSVTWKMFPITDPVQPLDHLGQLRLAGDAHGPHHPFRRPLIAARTAIEACVAWFIGAANVSLPPIVWESRLRMAMLAGAMLGNMREAWWMPAVEMPTALDAMGRQLFTLEQAMPGG